ncbi:MAG: hypothetical protein QW079_00150 [Nitrososphaerota archaeon]
MVRSTNRVAKVEAAIFDCDGVIIEARNSYDTAIKLCTAIVVNKFLGIEVFIGREIEKTIKSLRMTGGFNNDSDTTSTLIQAIITFASAEMNVTPISWDEPEDGEKYLKYIDRNTSSPEVVSRALNWLASTIENMEGYVDLKKVEELITAKSIELGVEGVLSDLRKFLNYPGNFGESFLATLFDEVFLGEEGVREKYRWISRYIRYRGTLLDEKVLVREDTLIKLNEILPRGLALLTGRGRWETEKTLRELVRYFKIDYSVFTADKGSEYEKPSPLGLIEISRKLNTRNIVYVGDSIEDLMTSIAAHREGVNCSFIGVTRDQDFARKFLQLGADVVVEDVNTLPSIIEDLTKTKS